MGTDQESFFENKDVNNFTMNIQQGIDYCFRVRANNSCASGMWSHETCKSVCANPSAPLAPLSVRENENEITIRWDECKSAGKDCPDCNYELEVERQNG